MPTPEISLLRLLGFESASDLRSYLHIREYQRVYNLRTLVAAGYIKAYCCREYPDSCVFFVVVDGVYAHFKYGKTDLLEVAQIVKEIPDAG